MNLDKGFGIIDLSSPPKERLYRNPDKERAEGLLGRLALFKSLKPILKIIDVADLVKVVKTLETKRAEISHLPKLKARNFIHSTFAAYVNARLTNNAFIFDTPKNVISLMLELATEFDPPAELTPPALTFDKAISLKVEDESSANHKIGVAIAKELNASDYFAILN